MNNYVIFDHSIKKNSMYNNFLMGFIFIFHLFSSNFDKIIFMYNLLCLLPHVDNQASLLPMWLFTLEFLLVGDNIVELIFLINYRLMVIMIWQVVLANFTTFFFPLSNL